MKSKGSYISSFIITLILVFTLIASVGCITADKFASSQNLLKLTEEKEINNVVHKELEKYFSEKYADTGIPVEVHMKSINQEYLSMVIKNRIDYGFAKLNGGDSKKFANIPVNTALDKSITTYFEEYAKSTNYEIKDGNDPYYEKLAAAKNNAHAAIEEYCDVYKFNALIKHGIISKIKPIFIKLDTIKTICICASAFLAVLLLICNFKRVKDTLYWIGTGSMCAGVLGCIPCIYLLNTNYFSSFTIKQPQIYISYTTAMRSFTESVLFSFIMLITAAVVVYVLYGIISAFSKEKSSEKANTKS